jgi:hypothetical protein
MRPMSQVVSRTRYTPLRTHFLQALHHASYFIQQQMPALSDGVPQQLPASGIHLSQEHTRETYVMILWVLLFKVLTRVGLVFPQEYKARSLEVTEEQQEIGMILPLFIMDGICFPGEDFPLHVYDPRYRIMLK